MRDSEGYESDSEGYESDSEGYESDSEGYRPDHGADRAPSSRTPAPGAGRAWPEGVDLKLRELVDSEAASRGESWRLDCIQRWRYFEDLVDPTYADKLLAPHLFLQSVLATERWPPRRDPPQPTLPQARLPAVVGGFEDSLTHQVNVRLRDWDYVRLAKVANRYGIAATTLARLFVTRGLEAALDDPESGRARVSGRD